MQSEHQSTSFTPQVTADGSYTFFSPDFQEAFHSHQGARLEAELKFVKPAQIARLATRPRICLLDVCYGLGYNTAAALHTIWQINPACHVYWIGLELDPIVPQAAIAHHLLDQWPQPIPQRLTEVYETVANIESENIASENIASENIASETGQLELSGSGSSDYPCTAQLVFGDARQTIQAVYKTGFQADAIFLDPFSPIHCPQLWTVEFLAWVVKCLAPEGRLATYSCSAAVRTALTMTGLHLGSTPGVGRKSPGTIASFTGMEIPPLSRQEGEHLQTRAAIPYRDPTLADPMDIIIQRRRQEQSQSSLETTSQWKKRWLAPKN